MLVIFFRLWQVSDSMRGFKTLIQAVPSETVTAHSYSFSEMK